MNLYTSLIFILTSAVLCDRMKSQEKSYLNWILRFLIEQAETVIMTELPSAVRNQTWREHFCVLSLQDNCVCLIRRLFYLPDCFVRWLRASSSLGEERSSFCFLKNNLKVGGESGSPSPYRVEGCANSNLHKKWIRVLCSATKSSFLKNLFLWNRIFSVVNYALRVRTFVIETRSSW